MEDNKNNIIALIPARYGSTRFPGKALVPIQGRPMIQWVYERAKRSRLVDRVVVATDDERIRQTVSAFGGEAVMTSPNHTNGTDRIAEVARGLSCDIVVNVQGDEPLIRPEMIDQAIEPMVGDPTIPMGTLGRRIDDPREAFDPNVVKVVFDKNGFALYFSRAPIPWDRDRWAGKRSFSELTLEGELYKHFGLYVYRRDFLLRYATLPQTALESREKLEQLRALEHGYRIRVTVTEYESFGVDIPEDLGKILSCLKKK
ncbi:MAG TPA: 3-deoxy-manno-octulosonate cytidylyltransferase [Nitrospirota bacterium]|nr:3-deoxy-manno-octulosonate cytidylyltransferase [Nitrospirota bacterium]